jgi:hypothetical protein
VLLSPAFGVLVAVVIASLRAQSPAGKLQAEFEQLRDRTVEAAPTRPTHLQLAELPKRQVCPDPFMSSCPTVPPAIRPVTSTR